MTDTPNNLRYSKSDASIYKELTTDDLSPFAGRPYKDLLVYAAAYGYHNGIREPLERPQPNIPFTALSDQDLWILRALAIDEANELNVLQDGKTLYVPAEEYANGAVKEIYRAILAGRSGDPLKRMTSEVLEMDPKAK